VILFCQAVKKSSDAASVSSVSDTDDSFVWRAHGGSEVDSDNESNRSASMVDTYLKALEERGITNMGDTSLGSMTDNRTSMTKTTTRRVIQTQNYTAPNGIDEYAIPMKPGINDSAFSPGAHFQNGPRMSDSIDPEERLVRTPSNASSLSYRSGRGDPYTTSQSTVETTVAADGTLVTTYTTRTTTISEEPVRVTKQYLVKSSSDQPEYEEEFDLQPGTHRSSTKVTRHYSSASSSTLPREVPRVELSKPPGPSTLPRDYRPAATSTPDVLEEDVRNPDGSVTRVKKVVSTTTHVMENDEPVVEVTISPMEMRESLQRNTRTTTTTTTSRTSNRSEHEMSADFSDVRSPRSPNGYLVEESTRRVKTTADEYTDGREESSLEREGSMRDGSVRDGSVRDNVFSEESISRSYSRGSSTRSTGPKAPTDRPPSYKAKNSGTGGFIVEETITSKETSTVETSANGTGYDSRVGRGTALEVNYHEDEEKKVRHEYEIDLLDLKQFLQTEDLALKANAAGYIQHLCFNDDNIKAKIRELDIIPLLVKQLEHPDEDCHRNAAGALKNLSYGRYLDDNKAAIQECSGIPISVKLLYNTTSLEVREYITGILYNLSSAVQCREELLTESVKAVAVLIVLPLSGWERSWYLQSNSPSPIIWSLVLRNSIGLLRNTSAAGIAGRQKIRREAGLVDALVWMLRAAFLSGDPHDINNKVIENIVCTLRNISYKIDMEIDRDNHADAIKVEDKVDAPPSSESGNERSPTSGSARRPLDAVGTGCLFMKKKPQRLSRKFRKKAREEVDASPTPSETVTYVLPKRDLLPLGVELIWDPDTVDLYIKILKICNNPVTLEAAAGAIHNLIACQWNWAAYLRTYVRKQEGLGPVFELLTVQQEYVVRAVALVLRNLALEERCKLVIGKNAMSALLAILPMPSSPEGEEEPSEYTICAILGTLQVLTHSSVDNCKRFVDHGGIKRVVSLTREKDPKQEKPLRTYSQRIILAANRVLMQIWDHEQFQEQFRNELWSHSRAVEEEKSHKTETLKQPRKPKRDTFAEMEERQRDIPLHRDSRRFVMIEDIDDDEFEAQKRATLSARERMASDEKPGREEYEMKNKPPAYSDDAGEQDPLVSKDKKKKEKKKGKKGSASKEEDEEDDVGETTPLYTNPVYVNKKQKEEDTVELQDGSQADSWV